MASATALQEGILSDVGAICKRLLNHRPVIQNEVHYFVKEFESKREHSDLRVLQDAMRKANEMDAVYLEEITGASPQFRIIREKAETINTIGNKILEKEMTELQIPQSEQDQLDQQLEECRKELEEKQQVFESANNQEVEGLKQEIDAIRESRNKMRSVTSSVSSGVSETLYPSASPSSEEDSETATSPQPGGGETATSPQPGGGETAASPQGEDKEGEIAEDVQPEQD